MAEIESFFRCLQEQFRELDVLLTKILKEEKAEHDEILMEKGFIIRSYYLNYSAINFEILSEILEELENVLKRETKLYKILGKHFDELNDIEIDYEAITKKKLPLDLFLRYFNEALDYSLLMITRIKQLKAMLQDGMKLYKKSLPKETEMFFASFENVGTKILRFVRFSEQLMQKIVHFEKEAYYPEPRTYGRAMASPEYKETIARRRLSSSKDPTPVFDAPRAVVARIKTMPKDQRGTFFGQIGVVGGTKVVFFQTRLKPVNHDNAIPQSNGLREYKLPKGIEIALLEAA